MTTSSDTFVEPQPELRRRRLAAGEARVAAFTRIYDAPIDDVWAACTEPDRLRRWYVPVTGDLRLGGTFQQAGMGSGEIVRCEPPRRLTLSLGRGADEIDLRLTPGERGATVLELEHATTLDEHEIGGQVYDAIFCMGGGYYPRFVALDRYLRGELPEDYDALRFHERPDIRPAIERGSAAMATLLEDDAGSR
jgi:uncharacterized protein YndB with AHSA1/START domain